MNGIFVSKDDLQIFLDLATIQLRVSKMLKEMEEVDFDEPGFFISVARAEAIEKAINAFNERRDRYLVLKDEVKVQMESEVSEEILDNMFTAAEASEGLPAPSVVKSPYEDPSDEPMSDLDSMALMLWESSIDRIQIGSKDQYEEIAAHAYLKSLAFLKAKKAFEGASPDDDIDVTVVHTEEKQEPLPAPNVSYPDTTGALSDVVSADPNQLTGGYPSQTGQ